MKNISNNKPHNEIVLKGVINFTLLPIADRSGPCFP